MALNKSVTLKVNGIHCNGCASKIKKSIEELGIDQSTEIDISTGEVKVKFDATKASVSDIKSKVVSAGYQVESMSLE